MPAEMPDIRAILLVAAMLAAAPVAAETGKQAVDLELVLAVDVSGSVDSYEAQLQRDGYVQAILDPNILLAIQSGVLGRIAATYIEWAGFDYQRTAVVDTDPRRRQRPRLRHAGGARRHHHRAAHLD